MKKVKRKIGKTAFYKLYFPIKHIPKAEGEDYENRQEIFTKLLKNEISVRNQKFEFSVGMATYNPGSDKSFKDVFERADQEMYLNKKAKKKYE